MSKLTEEIAQAFGACGLRVTAQRFAVLEFLAGRGLHATAEEILEGVNRSDPRASRATVYNSLHALLEAGLVREAPGGEGKAARFDANLHRHHHFVCDSCGTMEDIDWFDVPATAARPVLGGRRLRTCEVVLRGVCERCAAPKRGERR